MFDIVADHIVFPVSRVSVQNNRLAPGGATVDNVAEISPHSIITSFRPKETPDTDRMNRYLKERAEKIVHPWVERQIVEVEREFGRVFETEIVNGTRQFDIPESVRCRAATRFQAGRPHQRKASREIRSVLFERFVCPVPHAVETDFIAIECCEEIEPVRVRLYVQKPGRRGADVVQTVPHRHDFALCSIIAVDTKTDDAIMFARQRRSMNQRELPSMMEPAESRMHKTTKSSLIDARHDLTRMSWGSGVEESSARIGAEQMAIEWKGDVCK